MRTRLIFEGKTETIINKTIKKELCFAFKGQEI